MRKNKSYFLIIPTLFVILATLFSCKNESVEPLPKFNRFDIAPMDMDGFKQGDTIFHKMEEWEYLNEDSVVFSSTDIKGKIWIANFFFSYCPTICKPMNLEMKEINHQLQEYKGEIAFISFSIDEKRDSPSRLRRYKELLEITADNWTFLTGNQSLIYDMAYNDFLLLAEEDDSAPGGFIHSSNLVLVDQDGFIRGFYDTQIPEQRKRIVSDVKRLLNK